jgi:hypothetical protein
MSIQGKARQHPKCWLPQDTRVVFYSQRKLQIDQKVTFACISDVFHFTIHKLYKFPTHAQAKSFLGHAAAPIKHLVDELLWNS